EQRAVAAPPERVVEVATGMHQLEAERPVHGTDSDVHRTGPVDPDADRIGADEVVELGGDLAREALVARQLERLPERDPMLTARQLPRILHVGVGRTHLVQLPFLVWDAARKTQGPNR